MKCFVSIFLLLLISSCHLYDPLDDITVLDNQSHTPGLYYFETHSSTEKSANDFLKISLLSSHYFVLDEDDRRFLYAAIQHSLENMTTGKTSYWENRASQVYGYVTPIETFNAPSGLTCRQFKNEVVVRGDSLTSFGLACRGETPKWKAVKK